MSTNENSALAMLRNANRTRPDSGSSALALLRANNNMLPVGQEEEEEDDKNDLLQAGAGVLEGILDPLSVIPFVDRKLQQLEQYRGSSTGGKIGYGIGAIAGFALPYAPANLTLKAGTAAARGLKLVKNIDNADDVVKLADKMTELTRAGTFVQGAVSGGLMGAGTGEGLVDTDSRMLDALQGAAFGGIADVALSPIWRAISGVAKASKTQPKELTDFAQEALKTGATDNAPVVADEGTAALISRALSLADNVLGTGADAEDRTAMGFDIARSLRSVEAGELRVIPSVGKNHAQFVAALKQEGMDVVEATGPGDVSSFLIGPQGTLGDVAAEFSHYGFVRGQTAVALSSKAKGLKGTILGAGEKAGSVRVLFPGKKIKEVPKEELYFLPTGYTKSVRKSIGKASSLWGEFEQSYADSFSSDVLAEAARKLSIATGDIVEKPAQLSFDGAFEKFARDKGITGAQQVALKDYFVRRQSESLRAFAKEETEILDNLRNANKGMHPEGALVERSALAGYKVLEKNVNGKRAYVLRDIDGAQSIPFATREAAVKFAENRGRELPDALEGIPVPVSNDLLNTGGVAASIDEAGREPMLSPGTIEKLGSRKGAFGILQALKINPRLQQLLAVEEIAAKNGESFPIWSEVANVLNEANTRWVNKRSPYLNEAVKVSRGFLTKNIRPEKNPEWVRLMESDPKEWGKIANELGLNEREVKAAQAARTLFKKVWDNEAADVGMTADQYIEFYWPRMREFSQREEMGETFADYLRREAAARSFKASEKDIKFFNDLHRTGQLTEYETEPLVVMTRYINGITFKSSGAADDYSRAIGRFNELVEQYKGHKELAPHLVVARDYTRLVQGQLPEVGGTIDDTMKAILENTGMSNHLDQVATERFTALFTALNYGAFMGFRVASAVMNATQIGHVYMKHGAKYTAMGIKSIVANRLDEASGKVVRDGMEEAVEAGAVRRNHMRIPYEDQVRRQVLEGQLKGGTTVLGKAADTGLAAAEFGGIMFSKADEWLRGIAYHAQKRRAIEAYNKFRKNGWDGISRNEAFEEEAGLTQLGEVITQGYYKKLVDSGGGNDVAAKWLGVKSANETQFQYQTGTGPIAFSRGAMKLFGQYGTWPTWYIDFVRRGLTVGTQKDKIKFAMRGAAWSGGLVAAGYATGVSTTRWHGPTSIFFAGGPVWDKTKDATTIWGGVARPGGPPLETRITLAEYGIKYDEDALFNYTLDKPGKLFQNTVGQMIPGQGAARDIVQAKELSAEGGSIYDTLLTGLGFHMEKDD